MTPDSTGKQSTPTDFVSAGTNMLIAHALQALSYLFGNGRVEISQVWSDTGSGAGFVAAGHAVRVDVTGYPGSRGALLAGLTDMEPGFDWRGGSGLTYREWNGKLLTMDVQVVARIESIGGLFTDLLREPVDEVPTYSDVPEAPAVPVVAGPVDLLAEQPLVEQPEPAAELDHRPLLGLLKDERFGPTTETAAERGHTTAELSARYANVPGVRVVPGGSADPEELHSAWSAYAQARALHEFDGHTFPSLSEALTAINMWPGRDMLEPRDALAVAEQLVDSSAAESHRGPRRNLRDFIPAQLRRRTGTVVSL